MNDWLRPRGSLERGHWSVVVDATVPGWSDAWLRVADLDGAVDLPAAEVERIVVPLAGSFAVTTGGEEWRLAGRTSVFAGPTDVLSLGPGTAATVEGSGRVAVAEATSSARRPASLLRADEVPVEQRGGGAATRTVLNFGVPRALPAERLIVCEVVTPAGNWSSYPAHKHDEATATESRLEEVYYFEATGGADPFGLFVAEGTGTAAVVRTGDVVLVPSGWHGPAAAPPGVDLYYLNVMAGPERDWRITDHPGQAWIRDTWAVGS